MPSNDQLMPCPVFAAQTEPLCLRQATVRQLCFGEVRRDSGRVTHLSCLKNVSDEADAEAEIMTPPMGAALGGEKPQESGCRGAPDWEVSAARRTALVQSRPHRRPDGSQAYD